MRTARPTLLLAEDHADVAAAFRQLLDDHFTLVGVVADGERLITRALELQPDVILTDLRLQGLDGLSATIELRQRNLAVPIVLMSGDHYPDLERAALAAGASAFVSKADTPLQIVDLLQTLLRA
jgi:CheY-like chemotaxis protein